MEMCQHFCPSLYQKLIVLAFKIFNDCLQNTWAASAPLMQALVPCELWFIVFSKMEIKVFPPKRRLLKRVFIDYSETTRNEGCCERNGKLIKVFLCFDK